MADSANIDPVRVTAEERVHPAMQKLARALIALVRTKQAEEQGDPLEHGSDCAVAPESEAGHD